MKKKTAWKLILYISVHSFTTVESAVLSSFKVHSETHHVTIESNFWFSLYIVGKGSTIHPHENHQVFLTVNITWINLLSFSAARHNMLTDIYMYCHGS